MPAVLVISLIVNFGITYAGWHLGFIPFPLHASSLANYEPDPQNLSFAPVDPNIINDARNVQPNQPNPGNQEQKPTAGVTRSNSEESSSPSSGPGQASSTPTASRPGAQPTLPPQASGNGAENSSGNSSGKGPIDLPPVIQTVLPPGQANNHP